MFELRKISRIEDRPFTNGGAVIAFMTVRVWAIGMEIHSFRLIRRKDGTYIANPPSVKHEGQYVFQAHNADALKVLRDDAVAALKDAGMLDG